MTTLKDQLEIGRSIVMHNRARGIKPVKHLEMRIGMLTNQLTLAASPQEEIIAIYELAAAHGAAQAKPLTCEWKQEDDYDMQGVYHTGCGGLWSFTEGNAKDNNAKFCPYCGGSIGEQA